VGRRGVVVFLPGFAGLAANTVLGAWWLDGVVALGIAGWAVIEVRRAWAGDHAHARASPSRAPKAARYLVR
jgi:hypothetical protein